MRTTLNLDDDLMRVVKARAAAANRTTTSLIEEAVRELMRREDRSGEPYRFTAEPVKGPACPGVDLNDRDALYDVLDGRR